jgi:NADH dehydrogenase/NADH:ubiquinone oxidoreductase subunit G
MFTVTIDGTQVDVQPEATILEAAQKVGVWIPTLCHNPSLPPLATCRICMVELDRGEWRQLVTACKYPVRRDITVYVSSDRAVRARRGVMELLLARSPDCPELQELAARMGVEGTPYPKVTESQRNCILCGLCVSVCEEVIGASAIGFVGRGVERTVATPFRMASDECIACGACAAVCPVGTIQVRIHEDTHEAEISPFKSRVKLLTCQGCGKRMVTDPVHQQTLQMLNKVKVNWEDFRERVRFCPECRRKHTAEAVGLVGIDN